MPELPEVETVKRVIEPQIANRKIIGVTLNRPEVIAYPDGQTFCDRLNGQTINGMARRGKFLQILLRDGFTKNGYRRQELGLLPELPKIGSASSGVFGVRPSL